MMDIKTYQQMQGLCVQFAKKVNHSGNKPLTPTGKKFYELGSKLLDGDLLRIIDVLTFDEFVEYGKRAAEELIEGEPWSFTFYGCRVTQEHPEGYSIDHPDGEIPFKKGGILIVYQGGVMNVINVEVVNDDKH